MKLRILTGFSCGLLVAALTASAPAQEGKGLSPKAQSLIEQEKVRTAVEGILNDLYTLSPATGEPLLDPLTGIDRLVALGPPVAPYMEAEQNAPAPRNFDLACLVLGRVPGPESAAVLRRALAIAERDETGLASKKKLWAVYGLAIHGEADAVDLLNEGKLKVARQEIMDRMSGLEAAAMLTSPGCLPRLTAQLDRVSADPAFYSEIALLLDALRRIADPATLPRILPFTEHTDWRVRRSAARAAGVMGNPAVADKLLAMLDDREPRVGAEAAAALEDLKPASKLPELLARLETEQDTYERGCIYRTIAAVGGENMIEAFRSHWGRPDPIDRFWVVECVGRLGSKRGLNLLRTALKDEDAVVAAGALNSLGRIGGSGVLDTFLVSLRDERWSVAGNAVQHLVQAKEMRAAPRIADRLLKAYLAAPVTDTANWTIVRAMGDALVDLRYTVVLPELRKAVGIQADATFRDYLEGLVRRLAAVEQYQDDRAKWIETAASPDLPMRRLAYGRLGDLGDAVSVKALGDALGPAESVEEGVDILRVIARVASFEAAPLVERILMDDAYDAPGRRELRRWAAWAARRIAGSRMAEALRRSAVRREGRDLDVLVYYAVLVGRDSIPTLRSLRVPRLRHFEWKRGQEQHRIDWIVRELSSGRSIAGFDRDPIQNELD